MLKNFILLTFSLHCYALFGAYPAPTCDTLITTGGQKLIIEYQEWKPRQKLFYILCDDPNRITCSIEADLIQEIRIEKRYASEISDSISSELPLSAQKEETINIKKLNQMAKWGGFLGTTNLLILLFAAVFSPAIMVFALPCFIAGLILGIRIRKKTKNKPLFHKQRRMGNIAFWGSLVWLALPVLLVFLSLIILLTF